MRLCPSQPFRKLGLQMAAVGHPGQRVGIRGGLMGEVPLLGRYRVTRRDQQPAAVETSESIQEQTRLFLQSGKKIEQIPSGLSGQPVLPVSKAKKVAAK